MLLVGMKTFIYYYNYFTGQYKCIGTPKRQKHTAMILCAQFRAEMTR